MNIFLTIFLGYLTFAGGWVLAVTSFFICQNNPDKSPDVIFFLVLIPFYPFLFLEAAVVTIIEMVMELRRATKN